MGTKLPGLETFHAPSSSSTSTSFSSMYSNGSGLTLGSHSTEFERMTSLLKSTNEKPSLMSHDTPTSHMTASDSLLSGLKSQPQTGSQPPAVSKVRPITRAAQYTSISPLGKLVHVMVQCVAVPARNQTLFCCIYRVHYCVQSALAWNFVEGEAHYTLGKLMNTYHIYTRHINPTLNRSSVLEHLSASNASKIRNGIMFDFYPRLHILSLLAVSGGHGSHAETFLNTWLTCYLLYRNHLLGLHLISHQLIPLSLCQTQPS